MADQSVSSSKKVKKRKFSEGTESSGSESVVRLSTSDVQTESSSLGSPSVDPPEETEPEHSSMELCTSKWTSNILNVLQILPVLTEVYTPMQLLSFAFDDNNSPVTKETVETIKNIILQSRTPLHDLDLDDLENTNAFTCFKLLLDKNLNKQWTQQVDLWNIFPKTCADKLDKLQTRVCKKFQVHGELFAQQLMYMNMTKQKGPLTEAMYQKLFEEFAGLFGINTISEPCITGCTIQIGNALVKSKPDMIFPDLLNTNEDKEDMTVIALCQVKPDFQRESDSSFLTTPMKTTCCSSGSSQGRYENAKEEIVITHLHDGLIGQHGGDLLTHLPFSSKKNGILGLIVQKTFVTFAFLRCDEVQFEKIKKRENKFASKPVIYYSKPYNYLKTSDRNHLIEPMLRLGFLQYSQYQ